MAGNMFFPRDYFILTVGKFECEIILICEHAARTKDLQKSVCKLGGGGWGGIFNTNIILNRSRKLA